MSILGRGLESLIPKKERAPKEASAFDVLSHQAGLEEPVYRFHATPAAAAVEFPLPIPLPDEPAMAAERTGRRSARSEPPRASLAKGGSVFWIDTAKIEPNPHQPRKDFNPEELEGLAASLRQHGMLQPLLVTKREIETPSGLDVRYELIAGEQRWRAAKLALMREVPVIVRTAETPEREKLELALIENVQREDLNALERAKAFDRLIAEFGLMHKEIAERIGKSREAVSNTLRILRLPEEMQSAIAKGDLTEGHARVLLTLEARPEEQQRVFREIRSANLTVRDAELTARTADAAVGIRRRGRPRGATLDPDARETLKRLEEAFGTKVRLLKRGEQGRIVVEFYSEEELKGILDRIAKREEGYV